ncbi:MAG: LPS export ABC transporter permease LptG [Candidatus Zixiibacteriota bacterium]|nr:MAG: LPS export ABC transporter permease LptG [candidate division Zixibacteria bacterium]
MTLPLRLFDRYYLVLFLRLLVFSLLATIAIFLVVDLIEHLDTFIDKQAPYRLVLLYYSYYLPYIVYLVLPVAVLLSALFTVGGLSRTNELTAAKASGIGLYRILWHLLAVGLLLSAVNFIFGETIVPETTRRQKDLYRYDITGGSPDRPGAQGKIYLRTREGEMVRLERFDFRLSTAQNLDWEQFDGKALVQRLEAPQATWRDSLWYVPAGRVYHFEPQGVRLETVMNRAFDLGFRPSDLMKEQINPETMGYWTLREYVDRLQITGGDPLRWRVDLAFKTAMPFTCAIVVLLGVPIAARYRRSGIVFSIGIGLMVSFIFFAFQQIGRVMGYNGTLPPHLAAWIGNGVFILFGLLLYAKARK